MKCCANKKTCQCGYRFNQGDQKGPDAKCPACGAPRPCGRSARPNGRCDKHGGKSLNGIAHPNFKTGIYANDLPHGLLEIWNEMVSDEEMLEGMADLKLLYSRLRLLLRSNNSFDLFANLQEAWNRFESASRMMSDGGEDGLAAKQAKQEAMQAALAEINALIRKGHGDAGRWQEIYSIGDRLVRLRESERRRLLDEQSALTADRAMLLITMIVNSVSRRVKDAATEDVARTILTGVSSDLMGVLGPARGNDLISS